MIRGNPSIPEKSQILEFPTPRGLEDVILRERRDSRKPANAQFEYGSAHPDVVRYPHHKLARVAPDQELGWAVWTYLKDREQQNLYNWETTTDPDWPVLRQTFVVLRGDFDPEPADLNETYPAPADLFEAGSLSEYAVTGVSQSRAGDPELDSLFVVVNVTRERLVPLEGEVFDEETGNLYPVSRIKVPAGTPGQAVNDSGQYAEVQPLNSLWSIKTIRQAAGLAGAAIAGVAVRPPYSIIVSYSWPAVLDSSNPYSVFYPPLRGGGYGRGIVTVNYWRSAYDGPCLGIVLEEWTKDAPDLTTIGQTLFPTSIRWEGALLQVDIEPTLHQGIYLYETSGTNHPDYKYYFYQRYFPATYPVDWPEYIDTKLDVRPYFGGYLSRRIRVYNPYRSDLRGAVLAFGLQTTPTTTRVSWVTGAEGTASVYIKLQSSGTWPEEPTATGLAGPDYTFTGLLEGTVYNIVVVFAVTGGATLTSNVLLVTTPLDVPAFVGGPFSATLLEDAAMTLIDYNITGGGLTLSASGLLAGLSFNTTTGVVSGTPTPDLSTTASVTIAASNAAGSASQVLTLNYTAKPTVIPSQVFSFLEGRTGVLSQIIATNLPSTWTPEWTPASPVFATATGLSFNTSTGRFTGNATGVLSQSWIVNLTASNAAGNRGAVPLTVNYTAKPTITPGQTLTAAHDEAGVSEQIEAVNSPTSWEYLGTISHPTSPIDPDFFVAEDAMFFDTDTGEIWGDMGNHTQNIGTWVLEFSATNAAGTRAAVEVTFEVTSDPRPTVAPDQEFTIASTESGISILFSATESPTSWVYEGTLSWPTVVELDFLTSLGLSFNTTTGEISGSTSLATALEGDWVIQVSAANASGNRGPVNVTIHVVAPPP